MQCRAIVFVDCIWIDLPWLAACICVIIIIIIIIIVVFIISAAFKERLNAVGMAREPVESRLVR